MLFQALFRDADDRAILPWRFPVWDYVLCGDGALYLCGAHCPLKCIFPKRTSTENFHVMNDLELPLIPGLKVVLLAMCKRILSIRLFLHDAPVDGRPCLKKYFTTFIRIKFVRRCS